MMPPPTDDVYAFPRYYAIGYQWNTAGECDFVEACIKRWGKGRAKSRRILDLGCGAGRHLVEFAKRGYEGFGIDPKPEMVAFVQSEAERLKLSVRAAQGSLQAFKAPGAFDAAICLMDTFRFLLTNKEIFAHLRQVASQLRDGGLYIMDFWVPLRWDRAANEIYQWEQERDEVRVRVLYLQYPESVDPVTQTFEDELVFQVNDHGQEREIRGGRTRTRLILPQEFQALVAASGAFDYRGAFAEFHLDKPLTAEAGSWRMVSVLQKHGAQTA